MRRSATTTPRRAAGLGSACNATNCCSVSVEANACAQAIRKKGSLLLFCSSISTICAAKSGTFCLAKKLSAKNFTLADSSASNSSTGMSSMGSFRTSANIFSDCARTSASLLDRRFTNILAASFTFARFGTAANPSPDERATMPRRAMMPIPQMP